MVMIVWLSGYTSAQRRIWKVAKYLSESNTFHIKSKAIKMHACKNFATLLDPPLPLYRPKYRIFKFLLLFLHFFWTVIYPNFLEETFFKWKSCFKISISFRYQITQKSHQRILRNLNFMHRFSFPMLDFLRHCYKMTKYFLQCNYDVKTKKRNFKKATKSGCSFITAMECKLISCMLL